MNTEETNEKIALFMDGKWKNFEVGNCSWSILEIPHRPKYSEYTQLNQLKYHSDWNWLMAVVDKIESMSYSMKLSSTTYTEGYGKGVVCHYCWFLDIPREDEYTDSFAGYNGAKKESKIDVTYKAVVNFIKRYNEEKENV